MIKTLRFRLAALFSCLIALVLAGALGATFFMARTQYKSSMLALSEASLASLFEKLNARDVIADSFLAKKEADTFSVIYITDNGNPLHFNGAWKTQTNRDVLLEKAITLAAQNGVSFSSDLPKTQSASFTMQGSFSDSYHVTAHYLHLPLETPQSEQKYVGAIMLQDLTAINRQLTLLLLQYLALWFGCTLLLSAITFVLTSLATRPTAEAMRRQNEFVAAASHELRSPLAVIKACLATSANDKVPPQTAATLVQTAASEADRMARLVDDLLLLASGDATSLQLQTQSVPLDNFCIELYERFHLLAMQQDHVLTLCLPSTPLPTVQADRERLTQLFSILIHNAISYAQPGTPIEIHALPSKSGAVISVVDHGIGIPDAEKDKVFHRFYRVDKSRTDKAHFGLGLSVAKELAAMHGATLALQDTSGGGCTFALTL